MATRAAIRSTSSFSKATYQDVLDAPPHKVAEVVDGTLHLNPRPGSRHTMASSGLGARIGTAYRFGSGGPGGWWILDEPELHLGEDILVPDLAGWRRERMPAYPDVPFFTLAPDWVCEVLSPSTRSLDRRKKRATYAREVVAHLWFVDPDARTLETFEWWDGQWRLLTTLTGNDPVCVLPFEATRFSLGDLWPGDGPTADDDPADTEQTQS